MECGAKEKKNEKKNKEEKRERERGGNDCKICFQKVIPPTLSVRILNVVFIVKSCQSRNGRQSALLTEFELKNNVYSSFLFVFCKRIYPLLRKMKEVASITRFTFSAVDFHSTGHILAAVGFCCYY